MKGGLWALAVVIVLVAVLLPAANMGYEESARDETVEDEELTLIFNESVPVEAADYALKFGESTTVTVAGTGNTLDEGTEYEWDSTNGTITLTDQSYDDELAEVDYNYTAQTDETRWVAAFLAPIIKFLPYTVLFVGAAIVLAWAGIFGSSSGFGGR